jgi:hypothetical protein
MDKKEKKQIKIEVNKLIKEGVTRNETFQKLKDKLASTEFLRDILAKIPSNKALKLYGKWNWLLFILMMIAGLYNMFPLGTSSISSLWYFLCAYIVFRKNTKFYPAVTVLSVMILVVVVMGMITKGFDVFLNEYVLVMTFTLFPAFILSLWLPKRFCVDPEEKYEVYYNEQGQKRGKKTYVFTD